MALGRSFPHFGRAKVITQSVPFPLYTNSSKKFRLLSKVHVSDSSNASNGCMAEKSNMHTNNRKV